MTNNAAFGAPGFRVMKNGTELAGDVLASVEGVTIEEEINLPAMFMVKLNIDDIANGAWRGIDMQEFKPGDEIKIYMGIDSTTEMMTGEVTALDLSFGERSALELRGFDRLHRLRFGTKRRSFKDMKDSDIASSIASDAGLSPQVDDTGMVHPYLFQNNQSDYEFLLDRAKRIGYELLVQDRTLLFRSSQEHAAPALTLKYGEDMQGFTARLKTPTDGSEVAVRGWDVANKEEILFTATQGHETTKMGGQETGHEVAQGAFGASLAAVVDDAVMDSAEAEKIAKARYNTALKEFIKGEGTCGGNPGIRAGTTVEISGLGDRFSGPYYVLSTVHAISAEGYKTTFKVGRMGV